MRESGAPDGIVDPSPLPASVHTSRQPIEQRHELLRRWLSVQIADEHSRRCRRIDARGGGLRLRQALGGSEAEAEMDVEEREPGAAAEIDHCFEHPTRLERARERSATGRQDREAAEDEVPVLARRRAGAPRVAQDRRAVAGQHPGQIGEPSRLVLESAARVEAAIDLLQADEIGPLDVHDPGDAPKVVTPIRADAGVDVEGHHAQRSDHLATMAHVLRSRLA